MKQTSQSSYQGLSMEKRNSELNSINNELNSAADILREIQSNEEYLSVALAEYLHYKGL